MPSKTAQTQQQYYDKLLNVMPDWFLKDIEESIFIGHLIGLAKLFQTLEQDAYDHLDETFIERSTGGFRNAHADERLIPDLGFIGSSRIEQIQKIGSRSDYAELKDIADSFLFTGEATLVPYIDTYDGLILDLDWNDNVEDVSSFAELSNVFSILIPEQDVPTYSYVERSSYVGRGAYASSVESTVGISQSIKRAIDYYKAEGVIYRIIQIELPLES